MKSMNDMLLEVVNSIGGAKKIGAMLWPELPPDAAQRKLLDCLNPERPAKLDPEQVLLLLKLARKQGEMVGIEFLCEQLHYTVPQPIEPKDEKADLQRQFIAAKSELAALLARMDGLSS
jgi:hypothetical protein